MKKLIVIVFSLVFFVISGCSQNNKKPGEGQDSNAPVTQGTQPMISQPRLQPQNAAIDELSLEQYAGVTLAVEKLIDGAVQLYDVPFNETLFLEGTELTVEVTQFYPDFVITEFGYTTNSTEPNNVAAKIKITGSSSAPEFDGWLFVKYPDVHPYENPDYKVNLISAIKK